METYSKEDKTMLLAAMDEYIDSCKRNRAYLSSVWRDGYISEHETEISQEPDPAKRDQFRDQLKKEAKAEFDRKLIAANCLRARIIAELKKNGRTMQLNWRFDPITGKVTDPNEASK